MRNLNIPFEEQEYKEILEEKERKKLTWKEFILGRRKENAETSD